MPDVHLVSLDPACEGLLYPSKVYGIRAAGRPLVWLRPGLGVEDLQRAVEAAAPPPKRAMMLAAWSEVLHPARTRPETAAEAARSLVGGP